MTNEAKIAVMDALLTTLAEALRHSHPALHQSIITVLRAVREA